MGVSRGSTAGGGDPCSGRGSTGVLYGKGEEWWSSWALGIAIAAAKHGWGC